MNDFRINAIFLNVKRLCCINRNERSLTYN